MLPIRKQRLWFVIILITSAAIALFLVLYALQQNIDFFYTPTQIAQGEAPIGHLIRAGGLVQPGSVYHIGQLLQVTFELTDKKKMCLLVIMGYYLHYFVKGRGLL